MWQIAAMAGLSIAQGISANQQASANARATAAQLLQSFNVNVNNIQNQANELNNQIGMELSKASFNKLKAVGNVDTMLAERNVAGLSATRIHQNVSMQEALTKDMIMQQAESKMTELQNNLSTAHLQYQQGLFQNEMNRQANTKSTGEMLVSASMAGVQGYSMIQQQQLMDLSKQSSLESLKAATAQSDYYANLSNSLIVKP